MTMTIRSSTLSLITFMLTLLLHYGTAHPIPEDYGQGALAIMNDNQDDPILVPEVPEEFEENQSGRLVSTNPEELRNLARLYQLLHLQYQKQQQMNQQAEGEAFPMALTLIRPQEGQNKDEDKRTSCQSSQWHELHDNEVKGKEKSHNY